MSHSENVRRGIERLDSKTPQPCSCSNADCPLGADGPVPADWRKKIDAQTLAMSSVDNCILGQIFGSYEEGLTALGMGQAPNSENASYGFTSTGYGPEFIALGQEWIKQLGLKAEAAVPPIRIGDIYINKWGDMGLKIHTTVWVAGNRHFAVEYGNVKSGEFLSYTGLKDPSDELNIMSEERIRKQYSVKLVPFKLEHGMFVTNETGKVYYIQENLAYEVASQKAGFPMSELSRTGLKEVTLPSGKKFRDLVNE